MKNKSLAIIPILLVLVASVSCKKATTSNSNTGAASPNANQTAGSPLSNVNTSATSTASVGDTNKATAAPRLFGTYEISEVHKEGVVTMVSELSSAFTFKADGTYRRESKRHDKVYHFDQGKFNIEGTDKLVLTIEGSNKGPMNPPRVVTHVFTLSHDGSELKMEADHGKVAVFRRVNR